MIHTNNTSGNARTVTRDSIADSLTAICTQIEAHGPNREAEGRCSDTLKRHPTVIGTDSTIKLLATLAASYAAITPWFNRCLLDSLITAAPSSAAFAITFRLTINPNPEHSNLVTTAADYFSTLPIDLQNYSRPKCVFVNLTPPPSISTVINLSDSQNNNLIAALNTLTLLSSNSNKTGVLNESLSRICDLKDPEFRMLSLAIALYWLDNSNDKNRIIHELECMNAQEIITRLSKDMR